MRTRILYLGSVSDFDTRTARKVARFMRETTGHRGLVVCWPRGKA